jgi:P-loop containing dynein motor region/P-loop containing dynein motor region D4
VILVGEIGSRKTSIGTRILHQLANQDDGKCIGHIQPVLPTSDVDDIISLLNKIFVCDEASGRYIPANGNSLVTFFDDLHLSLPNKYGTRNFWEFLRFFADQHGYWSTSQSFRSTGRVTLLAAADLRKNGVLILPERFLRHFSAIFLQEADVLENAALNHFGPSIAEFMESKRLPNQLARVYSVVHSSLEMVRMLKRELILNAKAPFYLFTAHDLEKVFNSFTLLSPAYYEDNASFHKFWHHEIRRVFEVCPFPAPIIDLYFDFVFKKDRISERDHIIFLDCVKRVTRKYFQINLQDNTDRLFISLDPEERYDGITGKDIYERIPTADFSPSIIEGMLNNLPDQIEDHEVVTFFPDAVNHFCRLSRIFSKKTDSHCILVCQPGTDTSLRILRRVASCHNVGLREIYLRENVPIESWRAQIRKPLNEAGLTDKRVAVCITLAYGTLASAEFWGDLHSILDGARTKQFWPSSEYDEVMNKISHQFVEKRISTPSATASKRQDAPAYVVNDTGRQPTPLEITQFWSDRVRGNLIVVIRVDSRDTVNHEYMCK